MYSTISSGALLGVSAYSVNVEVDIASGLPAFNMVGSLSCEVRESRERVMVSLKNIGLRLPPSHITVNLSPADRRKDGTAFDLPIAVGVLQSMEYFTPQATKGILFLGELGLDGEIKRVRGVLPIVREAARQGMQECIVPLANAMEGAVIPGITVRGAAHVSQVIAFLRAADKKEKQDSILEPIHINAEELFSRENSNKAADFAEVSGQESAKRAAEIAAAGFHSLLMVGPPGAGKSMIARRIPGILPPLTLEESLEVTSVFSVAGLLKEGEALVTERPFKSPHHTISQPALVGGNSVPRPGMISQAHRGILFLDELPEFGRNVLDSMRQPLEEHEVHIARIGGNVTYPCSFMLVCAMNPCPCGYYPDTNRCCCSQTQVQRYMGKISGPILDRIDLCVELRQVKIESLQKKACGERSDDICRRVMCAREKQAERFQNTRYRFNADIEPTDMEKYCFLGRKEQKLMEQLFESIKLSARAYHRIMRVARTIADLEQKENIEEEHLLEAAFYRPALPSDLQGGGNR